jgi:anti-anti-sigma factor
MDSSPPDGCAPPVLRISTTRKRRSAHVALVGDLDVTAVGCLQSLIRSIATRRLAGAIRLDLSDLRFVDLAGFRALADACDLLRRRSVAVEVTGWPESLDRIASLTGADLLASPAVSPPPQSPAAPPAA